MPHFTFQDFESAALEWGFYLDSVYDEVPDDQQIDPVKEYNSYLNCPTYEVSIAVIMAREARLEAQKYK